MASKRATLLAVALLLLGAACAPDPLSGLQTLVASLPEDDAPLGGQVAALPTPKPDQGPTPTPPPSSISLPTLAPTLPPMQATLNAAVSGMMPTPDSEATPYTIALRGRPHFIEFHAWW